MRDGWLEAVAKQVSVMGLTTDAVHCVGQRIAWFMCGSHMQQDKQYQAEDTRSQHGIIITH